MMERPSSFNDFTRDFGYMYSSKEVVLEQWFSEIALYRDWINAQAKEPLHEQQLSGFNNRIPHGKFI